MQVGCIPDAWLSTEQYMDIARQPVPDHQEVMVEPPADDDASAARRPEMLFVDLQELLDGYDLEEATRQHVDDVLERMGEDTEQARALDVASFSTPIALAREDGEAASTRAQARVGAGHTLVVFVVRVPRAQLDIVLSHVSARDSRQPRLDMLAICSSLCVLDWGLFGS